MLSEERERRSGCDVATHGVQMRKSGQDLPNTLCLLELVAIKALFARPAGALQHLGKQGRPLRWQGRVCQRDCLHRFKGFLQSKGAFAVDGDLEKIIETNIGQLAKFPVRVEAGAIVDLALAACTVTTQQQARDIARWQLTESQTQQ